MKTTLFSVGTKMPRWVQDGFHVYEKRIVRELGFASVEIPLTKRSKTQSIEQCVEKEATLLLSKIESSDYVIAFEVTGKSLDTPALAHRIQQFKNDGRNPSFIIGGPDGLADSVLQRANEHWSLSALTLPHPLVRILVAEQLYRAITLLAGHPYHRD